MISNILFKKPVPVGALFLSDNHLESVHRILADLVYVESETKEGSNIMQEITKDIPIKEATKKPDILARHEEKMFDRFQEKLNQVAVDIIQLTNEIKELRKIIL